MQLAPQVGVPAPAVEANLPTYEQQAQLQQNRQIMQGNPVLAQWIAANPPAARIAQDDFDKLDMLSKALASWKSGAVSAIAQNQLGRAYNEKQLAGVTGGPTPDADNTIKQAEGTLAAQPRASGLYGTMQSFSSFAAGLLDNVVSGAPEAVGGAAIGAGAGGVGAIPGAIAGGIVGMKLDMSRVSAGMTYRALTNVRDSSGGELSEPSKQIGSLIAGALTYGIAGIGSGAAQKVGGEAIAPLVSEAVTQAMTRPTVAAALRTATLAAAKGGVQGAALNAAMDGAQIIGEEVAKQISPGDFQTVFNDDATRQQAITRLADAAESGALLFGGMHGVGAGVHFAGDMLRVRQAQADMQTFQQLQDGAADSATRARSPDAFASFLQSQTNGTPVENLFVPAERIAQLYQSKGVDPTAGADPLFGWMPDMSKQLNEALPLGGDVVIPTADYLAHMAGTDVSRELLPDIRVRQDGMSLNDAKTFRQSAQEGLARDAQQLAGVDDPVRQIFEDVAKQTTDAGFTHDASQQYASLFASRYAARAQRLGVDPMELYGQTGIDIRAAENPSDNGSVLAQPPSPVATLHGEEVAPKDAEIADLRAAARDYYTRELAGKTVTNPELGDIQLNKRGMKKALWSSANPVKLQLFAALPDILEKGRVIGSSVNKDLDRKKDVLRYHYIDAPVELDGKQYHVRATVEERQDGKLYYNHTLPGQEYFQEGKEGAHAGSHTNPGTSLETGRIASQEGALPDQDSQLQENSLADENGRLNLTLNQDHADARGSITMGNGKALIELFRGRDLSTLLHESGHLWLEEMRADAARPDAPEGLKSDFAAVLKWMGVDDPEKIEVKHHEQFARAAEAYFMEGKAPSTALASAFSKFKSWLTTIYKSITSLTTPINDDIRGLVYGKVKE